MSYTSDRGLASRIYKEIKISSSQKPNLAIKNWVKELNSRFSKDWEKNVRLSIFSQEGNVK